MKVYAAFLEAFNDRIETGIIGIFYNENDCSKKIEEVEEYLNEIGFESEDDFSCWYEEMEVM